MIKYYTLFLLSAFLFIGCSSTYTIKGYSSKEKFHKDFNSSADNKDLNITLTNDSLVQTTDGGIIKHDTLFTSAGDFPVSMIKTVNYKNRLKSTIFGCIGGELLIGIAGANILANNISKLNFTTIQLVFLVPAVGIVVGVISGYYIGWDVTYQFN
jgi:hypothetical protein